MSSSKFVSNLDGMNEDQNFSRDLLKVILLLRLSENMFYWSQFKSVDENVFKSFFLSICILESLQFD